MEKNERVAKALRSRVARLKLAGLCRDCGKRPPAPGKTMCEECLIKRRRREQIRFDIKTGGERKINVKRVPLDIPKLPEKCPICQDVMTWRTANLDHNHVTGELRGWICHSCNLGLGQFRDSTKALRAAASYLEQSE